MHDLAALRFSSVFAYSEPIAGSAGLIDFTAVLARKQMRFTTAVRIIIIRISRGLGRCA